MTFAEYLRSELKTLDEEPCGHEHDTPEPGELCPHCKSDVLKYDGMLNLVCKKCDYVAAGVCT